MAFKNTVLYVPDSGFGVGACVDGGSSVIQAHL